MTTEITEFYPSLLKVKLKWSHYRTVVAQREGRGIALLFRDRGTRRGWVVSRTPRPHFTPGKDPPGTHFTGGWMGPRDKARSTESLAALQLLIKHTHTQTHTHTHTHTHTRTDTHIYGTSQVSLGIRLETTFFSSYIYIYIYTHKTADEENVKYCFKFLSRGCLHLSISLMAGEWHWHGQSCNREYGTLHHLSHTVRCIRLSATDVAGSVTYIYFLRDYAVHFNTEEFHCGNLSTEEIVIHVSQEM